MKLTYTFARVAMIAAAVSLLSFSAAAQEKKITAKQVPAAVITAFKASYPNATIRGYAQEKENGKVFYEIESRRHDAARCPLQPGRHRRRDRREHSRDRPARSGSGSNPQEVSESGNLAGGKNDCRRQSWL